MSGVINKKKFDESKSIMKDKMPLMVEYFIEDSIGYIKSIAEGIQNNDEKKIKSPAHTIKSSANQLGADKVSDIAMQIESIAHDMIEKNVGSIEEVKKLFDELEIEFKKAEEELKKLVK